MSRINDSANSLLKRLSLITLFILLRNITTIGFQIEPHQMVKRMELELCLDQFDVHHDTIIRTEESLSIGGKYIQGLNIETLEQCQHLCCETENCDVFIFESKNGGYCYLFECGPPENFRCKFTRHANYTSAVLTPVRRMPTPTTLKPPGTGLVTPLSTAQPATRPQSSLSQHELELTNLKQKPDSISNQDNKPAIKITPITVPPISLVTQVIAIHKGAQTNSSCKRFQFQCHSGECIAVYNACDGIPQCEDGSDEGSECPANTSVAGKALLNNKKGEMPVFAGGQSVHSLAGVAASPVLKLAGIQMNPNLYQLPSSINNREDPLSVSSAWSNHQAQESQDIEHSSRIFNHKGGLQIPTNNIASPYQAQLPNLYNSIQRDIYIQPEFQIPYRGQIIQSQDHLVQSQNWQPPQLPQPILTGSGPYISAVNGQPVPEVKAHTVGLTPTIKTPATLNQPFNQRSPQNAQGNNGGQYSGATSIMGKEKLNGANNGNKNSGESEEYDEYEEKSTEPPKKKQHKHRKQGEKITKSKAQPSKIQTTSKPDNAPLHEQLKMIRDGMEMEFVDHDGKSERPGGAVLSLTLGIIVTAALGVLVGCRMRTVSRRSRRCGKAPYAHDADFLVNGMYL